MSHMTSHATDLHRLHEALAGLGMPINHYSLGRDRGERTCLVATDEGLQRLSALGEVVGEMAGLVGKQCLELLPCIILKAPVGGNLVELVAR